MGLVYHTNLVNGVNGCCAGFIGFYGMQMGVKTST